MNPEEVLYSLGEGAERVASGLAGAIRGIVKPKKSDTPPNFPLSRRIATSKGYTVHETMSLHLQITLLLYLAVNALALFLPGSLYIISALGLSYLLYLRWLFRRFGHYLIEPEPYAFFYFGVSTMAFFAFLGFVFLREFDIGVYYYYAYVLLVTSLVIAFRWYFKHRFGRDYAYGLVEEVKNDLVRVFVHDDIAANVKPGHYWVPSVPEAEPGRVVKLLVEERTFRSSMPVRILEVYLTQSSQTETEPKDEAE